ILLCSMYTLLLQQLRAYPLILHPFPTRRSSDLNIPLDSIAAQISKFKGKPHIVVFCRSGSRSAQAKNILERNGIANVINGGTWQDRKSTRLNSSHVKISYAVFCLKKKNNEVKYE